MDIKKTLSSFFGSQNKNKKEQPKNQNSSINKDKDGKEFATILEEKKKEQVIKDIFKLINKRGVEDEQEFTEFSRANGYDKKTYNECRTIYEGFEEEKRREGESKRRSGSLSKETQQGERRSGSISNTISTEQYFSPEILKRARRTSERLREESTKEFTNISKGGDRGKQIYKDGRGDESPLAKLLQSRPDKELSTKDNSNIDKTNSTNEKKNTPNQTINQSNKNKDTLTKETSNHNKEPPNNKNIAKKSFKKDNNKDRSL